MASQQQQQQGSKNKEDMLHEVSISRNDDCTKKLDHNCLRIHKIV